MVCSRCGAPVIDAVLLEEGPGKSPGKHIVLDAEPNEEKGTVILSNGECRYLDGPDDYQMVRQYGIPQYTRHAIRCGGFWPR